MFGKTRFEHYARNIASKPKAARRVTTEKFKKRSFFGSSFFKNDRLPPGKGAEDRPASRLCTLWPYGRILL
jgi:hypothetical protein